MNEVIWERLRPGDAEYAHISRMVLALPNQFICTSIDHNEDVRRDENGVLVATGKSHKGCSNPQCFKYWGINA